MRPARGVVLRERPAARPRARRGAVRRGHARACTSCSSGRRRRWSALDDAGERSGALARLLTRQARVHGRARHDRVPLGRRAAGDRTRPRSGPMGAEQSNTSIVFDEQLVLKVYRRLEPGINPELEMLRFLTERGFANIAALAGWYATRGRLIDATLGVAAAASSRRPATAGTRARRARDGDPERRSLDRACAARARSPAGCTPCSASDAERPDFAPEEPSAEALGAADRDDRRGDRAGLPRPARRRRGARAASRAAARRCATGCGC